MAININVNGQSINYPEIGDTNWADEATDFAVQTASAFGKLGLDIGTTVDIPGTLDVTGNTTLDANLSVGGNATITGNLTANGNSNLGNASSDTIAVTGILNVDSGVLYVDPTTNKVGINDATPSVELDVNGAVAITGNETVGGTLGVTGDVAVNTNKFNITATSGNTTIAGTLGVTGDVAVNTNKFNITASSGNTTIAGTLGVTGNTTVDGVIYADDSTTANTPVISFTGDTNTGIGRSAADTIDVITGGVSRAKLNSTGQQSSVVPDLSGSNTTLYNEYKCRAWVNFNGTTASPSTIRASGNVSSITKNATGDYTVNFTNALPDANYAIKCQTGLTTGARRIITQYGVDASSNVVTPTTTTVRIISFDESSTAMIDASSYSVAVFR